MVLARYGTGLTIGDPKTYAEEVMRWYDSLPPRARVMANEFDSLGVFTYFDNPSASLDELRAIAVSRGGDHVERWRGK